MQHAFCPTYAMHGEVQAQKQLTHKTLRSGNFMTAFGNKQAGKQAAKDMAASSIKDDVLPYGWPPLSHP